MTDAQENHLGSITQGFVDAMSRKYRQGQAEHGGNLWERNCLEDAMPEALDLVAYLHTAIDNQRKAVAELKALKDYMENGGCVNLQHALS